MIDLSPTVSVKTLDINGLNTAKDNNCQTRQKNEIKAKCQSDIWNFIMIKGSVQQEDKIILNLCISNNIPLNM